MALTHLSIHNFLAIVEAAIPLTKKINIFTGKNRTGKTSLACALEYLFTGNTRGLEFKKDAPALIHDGAKSAEIVATYDDGVTIRRGRSASTETLRFITKGQPEAKELPTPWRDWPAIALNPALYFEGLDATGRRAAMAEVLLTGKHKSIEAITKLLVEREIPDAFIAPFAELAMKSFEAAQDEAITKRRATKRAIDDLETDAPSKDLILAGRTYDLSKIEVDAVQATLKEYEGERDQVLQAKGAYQAPTKGPSKESIEAEIAGHKRELAALKRPDGTVKKLEGIIDGYEKTIEKKKQLIRERQSAITVSQSEEKLNVPQLDFVMCPVMAEQIKCPVAVEDRKKITKTFEDRKHIAETTITECNADIAAAKKEQAAYERDVKAAKEDITAIEKFEKAESNIKSAIKALEVALAGASNNEQQELIQPRDFDGEIAALDESLNVGRTLLRHIEAYKAAQAKIASSVTDLQELKERVEMYDQLDKIFSPNGIQVTLMTVALKQFVEQIGVNGTDFGAQIGFSDGSFLPTYNSRPYLLCSKSEQWQMRIALQEALAFGRVPYLIIDEADILDSNYKIHFAGFILRVSPNYENIFVCATESDVPPERSDHPDLQIWNVDGGVVKPV